jgi:hypothetical protein
VSCPALLEILIDNPRILPNLRHLVVNTPIFSYSGLSSANILADRPGVTLSTVRGELTRDGECLYNSSKDNHGIAFRG